MNTPSNITLCSTYSFFNMRGDPYFLLVQVAGLRKKYFEEAIFKKNSDFQKQTFSKNSVNSAIFKNILFQKILLLCDFAIFKKQTFSKYLVNSAIFKKTAIFTIGLFILKRLIQRFSTYSDFRSDFQFRLFSAKFHNTPDRQLRCRHKNT